MRDFFPPVKTTRRPGENLDDKLGIELSFWLSGCVLRISATDRQIRIGLEA